MRIISGVLRGKIIVPPAKFHARPTTDFAKEAIFNILENEYDLSTIQALDLFAGTGSIGFEFASRGCTRIDAIDINPTYHRFIKETAQQLGIPQLHALRLNAFEFPSICKIQYDIIFADPPYGLAGIDTLPNLIMGKNLLKNNGTFILEHGRQHHFNNHPCFVKWKRYGSVHFSFFKNPDSNL